MSLRFLSLLLFLGITSSISYGSPAQVLRICADPDNLPYSNQLAQGFDNRIAIVLAKEMHRRPVFVWTRERRGFLREQFNKDACDILMGLPNGMKGVRSSKPYYRSAYYVVTRKAERLQQLSLNDRSMNPGKIGLQILGEDLSPPSLPLIRSGHAAKLVGFDSFGNGGEKIVRAVAKKQLGIAIVWGPLAGYHAAQDPDLAISPVSPLQDSSGIPFVFDLVVGVHKTDASLQNEINLALQSAAPQISRILAQYHIPVMKRNDRP